MAHFRRGRPEEPQSIASYILQTSAVNSNVPFGVHKFSFTAFNPYSLSEYGVTPSSLDDFEEVVFRDRSFQIVPCKWDDYQPISA